VVIREDFMGMMGKRRLGKDTARTAYDTLGRYLCSQ
jgi:hypothetical protein